MSESPERPRLTRRQLREMEQARQAAEGQQEAAPTPNAGQPAAWESPAPGGDFATPPPARPTMTRRQLREAAEREAAAQRAAHEASEAQRAAEIAQQEAAARAQREAEERARQQAEEEARAAAEQARLQQEQARAQEEQARRAAAEQERLSAWQRAQEAPIPALETEDSPRIPADQDGAQRFVTQQQPRHHEFQPHSQPSHEPQLQPEHVPQFHQFHEPPVVEEPPTAPETPPARPGFYPAPTFADAPVVRPPAGVNAIRTVEETGELSPILHTAPGESVWPSIPGAVQNENENGDVTSQMAAVAPAQPSAPPARPAVPFRAPAWGARTSAPVDEPAVSDPVTAGEPGTSGMSAEPSRWPAGGGLTAGTAPLGSGATGSVFPGAKTETSGVPTDFDLDDDDDDEEEYEPMFTWLRLLVLMIIAFVLGALVWLIIGKNDAGGTAASLIAISSLKFPLGD